MSFHEMSLMSTYYGAARGFTEFERMMPPNPSYYVTSDHDGAKPEDQTLISKRSLSHLTFRKPPYTYVGMIVVAIENSPYKRLTLFSIYESITLMFPDVFSGEYQGWRDSVRHTLSKKACFFRIKKTPNRSNGAYWAVDLSKVGSKVLDRTINIDLYITLRFCSSLTAHLGLPDIHLPQRKQGGPGTLQKKQATKQMDQAPTESAEQDVDRQQNQPRRNISFTMASILGTETCGSQESAGTGFQNPYKHLVKQVGVVRPNQLKDEQPEVNSTQLLASVLNETSHTYSGCVQSKDPMAQNCGETSSYTMLSTTSQPQPDGSLQEDQTQVPDHHLSISQDHQGYGVFHHQAASSVSSFDQFSYPMMSYPLRESPGLSSISDDSTYWPYYIPGDVNSIYLPQRHSTTY